MAALWALGLTGFASMIYEVSWTRTLSLLIGSSVYAFTLMLVAFICGLGLGSMVLAGWIDRRPRLFRTLALLELAVGLTALLVEPLFGLLPLAVVELVNRYAGSFGLLHLSEFLMAFGLMFLPTFAAGGIFPAAAKLYTRHLATVGKSVGDAYAANTLGAVLGAFAGGFLLIPLIGVQASILAATALNIGLGIYFLWRDGLLSRASGSGVGPARNALGAARRAARLGAQRRGRRTRLALLLCHGQPSCRGPALFGGSDKATARGCDLASQTGGRLSAHRGCGKGAAGAGGSIRRSASAEDD